MSIIDDPDPVHDPARAGAERLLHRAVEKINAAPFDQKLSVAKGQAFFCGKVFAKDGYPAERETLAALGGAVYRATQQPKEKIAQVLREAYRAGQEKAVL
jgi:hypothetical protein